MTIVTALGGEARGGEGNAAECFAGVLVAAPGVFAAFLVGHAVLHHRHNNLGIPFQAQNRELAQCHIEPSFAACAGQLLVVERADIFRELGGVFAAAVVLFPDPGGPIISRL